MIIEDDNKIYEYREFDIYEVYTYNYETDVVTILGYKAKKHDWESNLFNSIQEVKDEINEELLKL